MDAAKEFFSCLALRHTPGLGPRSWKSVLSGYDSAYAAVSDARNWSGRKLLPKNRVEVFLAEPWRPGAEAEYRAARSFGARVITWFDPKYPKLLREIPDPPALLYIVGDVSLLRNPSVAVVGARECTLLGLQSVERISSELSRFGITVVSGLAAGIDRQAHLAGLSGIGGSIAVLGAGLDVHYPPDNEDVRQALEHHGLVVSEFGPGTRPEARNFPYRNRIISGLSLGVLVAEAAARSGSLITARLASEQGREVFALPGPLGQPTFAGCHRLIKQGAALVESAEDIVRSLRYQFSAELASVPKTLPVQAQAASAQPASTTAYPRPHVVPPPAPAQPKPLPANLTDEERNLLSSLTQEGKVHIDALIQSLGWESHVVSRRLLVLEMQGLVRQWPGMYYSLT
ncbi:MAG: DNA-protecting protein DprA [Deltaproteobacteria bacterium HGW-Deltaproteobacteria-8]|nr:MAG: DNA-protecting protein DprA [Deltaproteobacteria bacterium HGW-Deltaproteobacteria-8]